MTLEERVPNSASFNSIHNAVQACLEMLQSRSKELVVLASVVTPTAVMSAVVRSGALPLIVDLDSKYRQLSYKDLREIKEEVSLPMCVILERTVNKDINPSLLESVQDIPVIVVNYFTPTNNQAPLPGHFNVFILPYGALVQSEYELADIKNIRSGSLGLCADLDTVSDLYNCGYVADENKPCIRSYSLLHLDNNWKKRWEQQPSYPIAQGFYGERKEGNEEDSCTCTSDGTSGVDIRTPAQPK
jgi:hypothetical protein